MLGLITVKFKNRAEAARFYEVPYSTLRRFVEEELKRMGMESFFDVQYINSLDFPYLAEGYTFQYREGLTCWKVVGKTHKENEEVWVLIPLKVKIPGSKHFVNEIEHHRDGVPYVP